MKHSNYPGGFSNGVTVRGMPVLNSYGGNVFWVDSGAGSDTNKGTFDRPFSTLDYAIGQCTASNGDIIYLKPGHAETLSAAAAIQMDVAGISIIGMGAGSTRPTFTMGTTTNVDIDVSAANVTIQNVVFNANLAAITKCLDVTAAGLTLVGCDFEDGATNKEFVVCVDATSTTNNTADDMTIVGCRQFGLSTTNDHFLQTAADMDKLHVEGCYFSLGVSDGEAIIEALTGKDFTNCYIKNNVFYRLNTANVVAMESDTTANSGIIAENYVGHADTETEVPFDVTGARLFQNFATAVNDTSGYILPAVDS